MRKEAEMSQVTLRVTGMSCGHCVRAVTEALQGVDGVISARVDLGRGTAVVEYDGSKTSPAELVSAVAEEGYGAEEAT